MENERNIQPEKVPENIRIFTLAFQHLLEGDFSRAEDFSQKILHLSNQQAQLERMQTESLYRLETLKQVVAGMVSSSILLEKIGETNVMLGRQHYDERIVEPMVRSLLPVFDMIDDYRKHHDLCCNQSGLTDSIFSQLLQFISNYGIEMFSHSSGDDFDPKIMKPVGWESTSQEDIANSVARSLQCGFRLGESRILRQETVRLFKYEQPKETLTPLNEEN